MSYLKTKIASLAGPRSEKKADDATQRILDDLVKGAQSNPRTAGIEMNRVGHEEKLASARLSALDVAKIAGALAAYNEAEYSLKQASEALKLPEDVLTAVIEVTKA